MDLTKFDDKVIHKHYIEECKELIDDLKMLLYNAEDGASMSALDDQFRATVEIYARFKDLHYELMRRLISRFMRMDEAELLEVKKYAQKNLAKAREELKDAQEKEFHCLVAFRKERVKLLEDDIFGVNLELERRKSK